MQLTLNKLIPVPLKEKVAASGSDVWNRDVVLDSGNCVFIQAPSGTGKTTLMHTLYGLRKDYTGSVKWGSEPMENAGEEQWAALRAKPVSIIFQDMRLFPTLTLWENLVVKNTLSTPVDEVQITSWLQRLGIGHKKDALAATLSYGEQQRAAIIRALLQPFHWLLMDEPFSHLDHGNTLKAIDLIKEVVAGRHAGMVLADLDENNYFPYTKKLML